MTVAMITAQAFRYWRERASLDLPTLCRQRLWLARMPLKEHCGTPIIGINILGCQIKEGYALRYRVLSPYRFTLESV